MLGTSLTTKVNETPMCLNHKWRGLSNKRRNSSAVDTKRWRKLGIANFARKAKSLWLRGERQYDKLVSKLVKTISTGVPSCPSRTLWLLLNMSKHFLTSSLKTQANPFLTGLYCPEKELTSRIAKILAVMGYRYYKNLNKPLVRITVPEGGQVTVVGDVHGQLIDLLTILNTVGLYCIFCF